MKTLIATTSITVPIVKFSNTINNLETNGYREGINFSIESIKYPTLTLNIFGNEEKAKEVYNLLTGKALQDELDLRIQFLRN